MKYSNLVTASKRKNRKKLFQSHSNQRRKIMSSLLSKSLKEKYKIKSLPIRKDDEVKITRGLMKGKVGKIVQCHRKNFSIYIDKITRIKTGKSMSYLPISPSNVIIIGLSITNERKTLFVKKKLA